MSLSPKAPLKLVRFPALTHVLPPILTSRFAHLCLPRRSLGVGGSLASPRLHSRSCPCRFTLITRTSQCLRQLPSCVAVYPRDSQSRRVLCRCSRQLHCISLAPARLDRYPRGFTGHVAHPSRSILFLFGVQMPPKAGATRALRPFLDSSRRRPSKNSRSRIVGLRLFLIDGST